MPLLSIMLWLLPARADGWPLPVPDSAAWSREDEDGDGAPEERWSAVEGGSGWKTFTTCARHGASGHVACDERAVTTYALFYGERRHLQPATDNRAAALLQSEACAPADPLDPAQGAMEALLLRAPLEGAFTPAELRWHPGPPVDQQSVCLTPAAAARYPGGLTWTSEGALPEAGWMVGYNASWPQPQTASDTPRRVASTGDLEIYQQGHALAAYDPIHDRHAWIASFGDGDGFKVDRWERVRSVRIIDARTVEVHVARLGGADTAVRIALGTQLPWSAVGLPDDRTYNAAQVLDLDPAGQRCLLEGSTIEHIYQNGAALALSEDGGQTWTPARMPEDVDGSLTALAISGARLTMLRHRQIAGAFPLLLHSSDGGQSWKVDAEFDRLYWSLSPGSVAYARELSIDESGAVSVRLLGLWAVRDAETGEWRTQAAAPAQDPTVTPADGKCAARFSAQHVLLPAGDGVIPRQLHRR